VAALKEPEPAPETAETKAPADADSDAELRRQLDDLEGRLLELRKRINVRKAG